MPKNNLNGFGLGYSGKSGPFQAILSRIPGLSLLVAAILAGIPGSGSAQQTIFFVENFDDSNFASRGWYDSPGGAIDTTVHSPGGGNSSIRFSFPRGANSPTGGSPRRRLFPSSEAVYVSFWLKLGTAGVPWQGSGVAYHPHVMMIVTDANGALDGLAWNYLCFYVEYNLFTPRLAVQDGRRIDLSQLTSSYPGQLGSSAPHAVGGGNGRQDQAAPTLVDYYPIGAPNYTNATFWDSPSANLVNDRWHHLEAYVAMNSISGGVPQADGVIKYWIDGVLVVNRTNLYLRTAQFATQKFNQFMLAPYMEPGSGSPISQDMWIDNLVVADQRISSPTRVPPSANLRDAP